MKGERMAKRSTFGSLMRKRLSHTTNSQPQPKVLSHEEKPSQASPASEDLVKQLIKEKMTLMRLIEERNKIIKLSGNELQNLRINLQKLQLQNGNLAQSNSQILAELNLGREKVKALQHELVCTDALLKAKNIKKEEGEKLAEESMPKANDNDRDKPCKSNRRRRARSKSMGPSTICRKVVEKENVDNKRHCVRRQSARFKSQEPLPIENLFEIQDTLPHDDPMQEDDLTRSDSYTAKEEACGLRNEGQLSRYSMGRPSRKAAEKAQIWESLIQMNQK